MILRIISLCVICLTFYVAMCLPRLTTSNKTISYCYNAIKSWIGWSPNLFFGTNGLNMSIMFRRFMIYQLISPAAQREFIGLDELFYILAILTQFGYFWPVLITKYRLLSIIAVPMLVPIWNILKMIVESFFYLIIPMMRWSIAKKTRLSSFSTTGLVEQKTIIAKAVHYHTRGDGSGYQNGWIFGKVPNGLWPPPHFWKLT